MAKRKGRRKKSLASKVLDWTAFGIALSPVIAQGAQKLPSGDIEGFFKTVVDGYTGGLTGSGKIYAPTVIYWYGPIAGAIVFRKGMSMLMKRLHLGG